MNCQKRDQDLLLLSHGALGGLRRLTLQAHLRNCPRCQDQRERFATVSSIMAEAIRDDLLWRPPAPPARPAVGGSLRWSVVLALAILFATVTAAAMTWLPELNPPPDRIPMGIPPAIGPGGMPVSNNCATCHPHMSPEHAQRGSFSKVGAPAAGSHGPSAP